VHYGLFKNERVWGTLDEIIVGTKPRRKDARGIKVFDSTGLIIEYLTTAQLVYKRAKERGDCPSANLI
jgi:alanine dehydrogenase